jgi:hypothetical protein
MSLVQYLLQEHQNESSAMRTHIDVKRMIHTVS